MSDSWGCDVPSLPGGY